MTLKAILLILLDAAEKAFPKFAFLLEYLRPYLTAALPEDGGLVVVGAGSGASAAPQEVIDAVVEFLTGLQATATRPLVKVGLRVLISLTPYLVNLAWDSLFPTTARPVMATQVDFDAIVADADADAALAV